MNRLALTTATGLLLAVAIWHVQANAPRDMPEHALAVACRMTYDVELSRGPMLCAGSVARCSQPKDAALPLRAAPAQLSIIGRVLRMLGLPRMRATVELRP